jgi:hypothetical protein
MHRKQLSNSFKRTLLQHIDGREFLQQYASEQIMTNIIATFYSEDRFPHVLIYSTALTVLSLAAVGLIARFV